MDNTALKENPSILHYTKDGEWLWHELLTNIHKNIKAGETRLWKAYQDTYKCSEGAAKGNMYRLKENPRFKQQAQDYAIAYGFTPENSKAWLIDIAKRAQDKDKLDSEISAIKEASKLSGFYPDQKITINAQVENIYKEAKQEDIIDAEIINITTELEDTEPEQLTEAKDTL